MSQKYIVKDALSEVGISAHKFEEWIAEDEVFAKKVRTVERGLKDELKRVALKKVGILPMTDNSEAVRLKGWADNKLLIDLIKLFDGKNEYESVTQNLTLNISGLDMKNLGKLAAPSNRIAKEMDAPEESEKVDKLNEVPPAETPKATEPE